eukprot:TRINITY_DN32188_c0_g1_i1.p1 TRINITY_DN32188_c0_g1~~TRINITY_DN32188_c0_g1_i1.p1  ORF type:complete len:442 (-),score=57.00 TRINITY_DN32188_c0_g1_i1:245-1477(-)
MASAPDSPLAYQAQDDFEEDMSASSENSPSHEYVPRSVAAWQPPPMDAGTYEQILARLGRLDTVASGSSDESAGEDVASKDDYTEAELKLRTDFSRNKCVWVDSFKEDLWYFLINMNPVLTMCYSHPLHPISRRERFIVYGLSFVFVGLVSVAVAHGEVCFTCDYCLECRPGGCYEQNATCPLTFEERTGVDALTRNTVDPHDVHHFAQSLASGSESTLKFTASFCCQAYRFGALYFLEHFKIGNFSFGGSLYAFVANCVFSTLCFQLMMCGCVQSRSKRVRRAGERLGYVLFGVVFVCTIALGASMWRFASENDATIYLLTNALRIFVCAKVGSWIGTTIFNIFVFAVLFPIQRPKDPRSRFAWLDPPREADAVDKRHALVKAINPRFNVLACEYLEFGRKTMREEDFS